MWHVVSWLEVRPYLVFHALLNLVRCVDPQQLPPTVISQEVIHFWGLVDVCLSPRSGDQVPL